MTLYPSGAYDIPVLDTERQSAPVAEPIYPWGGIGRGRAMPGTWVFYVDDYRFSALERDPARIARSGPTAAAELNHTLFEQSSEAEVIYWTWRKRCASRLWQTLGIDVRVDLNVPERWRDICMTGVPPGWRSFATRGYAARLRALAEELAYARAWGGDSAITLVYGGGAAVQALCRSLPGAVYVPAHNDRARK